MKKCISMILTAAMILTMVFVPSASVFAAGNTDNGFGVVLDGQAVAFDASTGYSQNVDGRIMVPYRGLLTAMGATEEDVTYDEATKTVKAVIDGTEISFKVGTETIDIVYADGTKATETMDVAPFIDSTVSRTYVSTRFVAQAFGYGVGWDADKKSAVVVDWKTLLPTLGDADKDFSILAKLMKSGNDVDLEQVYESSTKVVIDATIASAFAKQMGLAEGNDYKGSMTVAMDGLSQGMDLTGTMKMTVSADEIIAAAPDDQREAIHAAFDLYKDASLDVIFDGETGVAYIKGELMDKAMQNTVENTWYKMDIYGMYESLGIDLKGMMNSIEDIYSMTPSELVEYFMTMSESYSVNTYANADYVYSVLKALLGDEAFTKKASGSSTEYTLLLDKAVIIEAFAANAAKYKGETPAFNVSDLDVITAFEAKMEFTESGDKITGSDVDMTISVDGMNVTAKIGGDSFKSEGTITMSVDEIGEFVCTISSDMKESTQKIDVTVPAGANIVDISDFAAIQ